MIPMLLDGTNGQGSRQTKLESQLSLTKIDKCTALRKGHQLASVFRLKSIVLCWHFFDFQIYNVRN